MPRASTGLITRPIENRNDAMTLLRLAREIAPNSLPALKNAAGHALDIVEAVAKFKLNREDWASFGHFIQNAAAGFIQSLSDQDDLETREVIAKRIHDVFMVLERTKAKVYELQQENLFRRILTFTSDPERIEDMTSHVDAALMPFHVTNFEGRLDTRQLLADIAERYTDYSITQGSLNGSSVEDHLPGPPDTDIPWTSHSGPHITFVTNATQGGSVNNVVGNYYTYQLAPNIQELPYAKGASWDPSLACLPGTRTTILSVIDVWARSSDHPNVFLMKGVAGSGKSAIAHTVAQILREDGRLASSFFFNRDDTSLNTPQLLFTTIARDIAARYPAIAEDISVALEKEPALASAPPARQFEAFIAAPLRRHPNNGPIVIVIDALDESTRDDTDTSLLTIFRDEASTFPSQLRIFITSRPTLNTERILSDYVASYHIDINSAENRQDISAYVDTQLQDEIVRAQMGPSWEDESLIRELKILAEGLFIWIATVFRYLRTAYDPSEALSLLLEESVSQGLPDANEKMDALYATILEACGAWLDQAFCRDYRLYMGAIMAAKRPLSLAALRGLHGGQKKLSPKRLLQRFGSVLVGFLDEHEPIRLLHLSFREFITDRAGNNENTRKFFISEIEHSERLAELCLKTMVREFTAAPISGTGFLERVNPPGIPEVDGVSEQLLYGCESLIDHIADVQDPGATIVDIAKEFLSHHIIIWIEVMTSTSVYRGSLAIWHWVQRAAPELKILCNDRSQASLLSSLSDRLSYAGRLEEALIATEEVVDLRRALASELPVTLQFNADLARSLNSLSNRLSSVGRLVDALPATQEAVDLYRDLIVEQPLVAVYSADLATSLDNLCTALVHLKRGDEAAAAVNESVQIRQALAADRPDPLALNRRAPVNDRQLLILPLNRVETARRRAMLQIGQ